jgi:hypothetical protein
VISIISPSEVDEGAAGKRNNRPLFGPRGPGGVTHGHPRRMSDNHREECAYRAEDASHGRKLSVLFRPDTTDLSVRAPVPSTFPLLSDFAIGGWRARYRVRSQAEGDSCAGCLDDSRVVAVCPRSASPNSPCRKSGAVHPAIARAAAIVHQCRIEHLLPSSRRDSVRADGCRVAPIAFRCSAGVEGVFHSSVSSK